MRGEDSEVHNAARRSLTDVWNSMTKALHKDITDKISLVDWVGMWADSLTAEKEPAWQNVYLNYMFRLLDASGDELVDLAEYIDVLGTFSVPRDIAIACFDKFATNSAGGPCNSINYNTFTNLWQQYFRSDDINDVGNHLLGTI
ncbi:hypothetical protein DICVIV_04081 [Dictyocaulus viviparus]|uniref:EF-hand domain-containing protein n=1 Tax=Dictyocaulus viviparus TaxID=29172 RepID=A0A0D8Y5B5_DICVI|nr:hypothetical protein DICVIV_04081 [Dictyocaulus viviparus]